MSDTQDSVVFSVRVPVDLAAQIVQAAYAAKVKRNTWIVDLLEKELNPRAAAPDVPVRVRGSASPSQAGGHGDRGEPGTETPNSHETADCLHPKVKVLKLKTCPDCGVRV